MSIYKMKLTRYLNAVSIKSKRNSRVNVRECKIGGYGFEFVTVANNPKIEDFVKFSVAKKKVCATEIRLSEESAEALFYALGEMLNLRFESKS